MERRHINNCKNSIVILNFNFIIKAFFLKKGSLLLGSFLLSVVNFTCFNIGSIKYNLKMHQIEKSAGEGITTVGKLMQESKVEQNPVI